MSIFEYSLVELHHPPLKMCNPQVRNFQNEAKYIHLKLIINTSLSTQRIFHNKIN